MKHIKKIFFRFFFLYFFLTITPWFWLTYVPGLNYVTDFYTKGIQWIVFKCNDWFLHVKPKLNTEGYGSGDTSYAWAEFYTFIILSLVIAIIWTILNKKEKESRSLEYWLHNLIRYNLIMVAFSYGIIKLFGLQMPFPNLSQLATPLGEFLPMRFSWMFIGYSQPYQFFSGLMEVIVGLLLLYRRTIPLGLIVGLGVFVNVFAMNMCYDIPVKLYSMQIVICCFFLLAIDSRKYLNFFILNKPTIPTTGYNYHFTKRWQRVGRIVLKTAFIVLVVGLNIYECIDWYGQMHKEETSIIPQGVYNIKTFKKNNQLIAIDATDTLAWKDFIFDKGKLGSIKTADTTFWNKYGRAYFVYETDKSKQMINFKEGMSDSVPLFGMKYKFINKKILQLEGVFKKDTLFYELVKHDKKFPLAERQFHWISEANR
ncbi:hypothetical protein [Flavobacterium sangjuense]|uniref:DoxX family protein n=1 Tax=Flavobacterium sangjuense TaxID=2518177 RepID=A0A4P7PWM6_9FLAO|nr:hypothetical protein [Flavobacterium sangjuense]QBZ98383.1 hypothetical protein GS03_01888 [Flavobacterium sangjuense]